jgi:hypothetical protein
MRHSEVICQVNASEAKGGPTVGRLARWWLAALFFWLWGLMFCEIAADGIAKLPQPDQPTWVLLFRYLPLGPVLLALAYSIFHLTRWRPSRGLALRCARILLIGGIVLVGVATPKP